MGNGGFVSSREAAGKTVPRCAINGSGNDGRYWGAPRWIGVLYAMLTIRVENVKF